MTKYSAQVKVTFHTSRAKAFAGLTDLKRYPLWNSGMVEILFDGMMREGMSYQSKSIVVGQENSTTVQVVRMVKNELIQLQSTGGAIPFTAEYQLTAKANEETEVGCTLQFELKGIALKFAHSVIESMAKTRIKGDLETLRALV